MAYQIELDCIDSAGIKTLAESKYIEFELLEEYGPAGGNPYIRLSHDSIAYLSEFIYDHWGYDPTDEIEEV